MTLEQLFANSTINVPLMLKQLQRTAENLGLPFGERVKTYNSRLAQELGLWAESRGRGEAFHKEAFLAYFARGENLAENAVLYNLAAAVGLDKKAAETVIKKRSFKAEVDAQWQRARELRISAVPTFVVQGQKLVGAQPYEELATFLTALGVARR